MKRALVFGTGNNFIYSCAVIEDKYRIIGLADNSKAKQGLKLFGYKIRKPEQYERDEYDCVILTPSDSSVIKNHLIDAGINQDIIINLGEALSQQNGSRRLNIAVLFYGGMGDLIIGKNWLFLLNKRYEIGKEELHIYCDKNVTETLKSLYADCDWISGILPITYESSSLVENDYDLIFRFSIFPYVQTMKDERVYQGNKNL